AVSYTDSVGPLRFGLYGNFFHTDGWNIIAPAQRGPIDQDSGSEHKTLNGRLEYDLAPNFSLFFRGAYYDESRNTGTPLRRGNAQRGFLTGGGTLQTADGSEWQLTVFGHLSRLRENFSEVSEDRTAEAPTQHQKVPSSDVGGAFTWERRFLSDHLLLAGGGVPPPSGEKSATTLGPRKPRGVPGPPGHKGRKELFWGFFRGAFTPHPAPLGPAW